MHANNEIGIIQDISKIKARIPDTCFVHTDAVQSYGKIPIDIAQLGVDFLSISAHKIHGPKGIGAMFIRKGIDFKSHQHGGGQERNRRAGTESPALIVGFQYAARKAMKEMEQRHVHMRALQDHMRSLIREYIPQARINTTESHADCLPSILNVSFSDIQDGESILQLMDFFPTLSHCFIFSNFFSPIPFTFMMSSIFMNVFSFLYSRIFSAVEGPIPGIFIKADFEALFISMIAGDFSSFLGNLTPTSLSNSDGMES